MSIVQLATDVRGALQQGAVGQWAANADVRRSGTLFNASPQAVQISTITVSGPTNSHLYTVTINGFNVTFTSDSGATTQEVVDGLVAAINLDARVRGDVIAVGTSATVVTLTGLIPGRLFNLAEAEADLAIATSQAAAAAAAVPVGRAMITQGYDTAGEAEELGALAASALLTAQVITIAFGAFVSGQVNRFKVYEISGSERRQIADVSEAAATDRDTTIDALVALLTTALPANTVVATADNATATALVFTASIKGYQFEVEFEAGHEGASLQTLTYTATTGPSTATSIHLALRGVSMRPLDEECATIGGNDPAWPGNRGVVVAKQGPLFVESAEVVTAGSPAFIELGVTADNGKLFMVGSATRVRLASGLARWERGGNVAADSLAVARLNFA